MQAHLFSTSGKLDILLVQSFTSYIYLNIVSYVSIFNYALSKNNRMLLLRCNGLEIKLLI